VPIAISLIFKDKNQEIRSKIKDLYYDFSKQNKTSKPIKEINKLPPYVDGKSRAAGER